MEQLFTQLEEECLVMGLTHEEYWNLTYGEIIGTIKANNRRRKEQLQEKATLDYNLANLIGISASRMMDKKAKMPPIEEAYPSLFSKTQEQTESKKPPQQDWRIMKERLLRYTDAHNRKRKEVK